MTRVEILRETSGFPPPGAAVPGAPPALDSQQSTEQAQAESSGPEPAGRSALPVDLSDPRLLYGVSGVLVAAAGLMEYWGRRRSRSVRR